MGVIAALVGLTGGIARADELKLTNGDVLRGEVLGGDGKAMKFRHTSGNEMLIKYDDVQSITTDKPVELKMINGTKLNGKLAPGPKAGSVTVQTPALDTAPVADLARVEAMNEPEDSAVWTGRLGLGATIQDGNSRSRSFFTSFDGERLTKQDRIEAHGYYTYAESYDQTSRDWILSSKKGLARLQYSYYVLNPLYVYAGAALEYDRLAGLNLRSRGGGGLGYAFFERPDLLLRTEAGLEYVNEDYRRMLEDKDFVALRGAMQFEWQATDWLRLGEHVEIFPNLEKFRDFFSRSTSSANVALWKGFGIAGVLIWEHDEVPASSEANRNDTTYIITFTYVF
jgi:putative salt-induced outer membrane protein YdiY